ncbi:MAG: Ig-like domain-containing protein [Pirellulales bacterium]
MKNLIGKSIVRTQRSRLNRLRTLKLESLEGRQLMAADLNPNHNYLIPEDTNGDFDVTPIDALIVINKLNKFYNGRMSSEGESDKSKWDVDRNGRLSPADALSVINRLNAEGEGNILMRYSYSITDPTTGNAISQVTVGNDFLVNVFFQDVRDTSPQGIFTGAIDLGVSDLSLADYQFSTTFFSGLSFSSQYNVLKNGFQGGGIQLGHGNSPNVADGETFSVTTSSGTVVFEFDSNSSVTVGNTPVTLASSSVTYSQAGSAIVSAINGSSLGITSRFNGLSTVVLPTGATFNALTSRLTPSLTTQEYFDEITSGHTDVLNPPDPATDIYKFFTVRFKASKAGTMTFNPNGPDDAGSENTLYGGDGAPLPNSVIDFGTSFSVNIVTDPTGPTAVADTISVTEDTARAITAAELLANDTSGANPARVLSLVSIQKTGSTQGSLSGNTYTPASNSNAPDVLTYTITDTAGLTSTGTITINITAVNDAPNAVADNFAAVAGSVDNDLAVLANDSAGPANESTQTLTITALTTPSNGGTVTIAAGGKSVLYTPDPAYVGPETFSYTVQDNGSPTGSSTATVTVDVQPATRPFAVRDRLTIVEDSSNNSIAVLSNDLVNNGQTALLVGIASNPANGSVSVNGTNILYTPNPDFFGTDTFTYAMNETNGTGADSVGTVTVTVNNVNDRPVLVNDPAVGVTIATEENAALSIPFASLTGNDSPGPNETDSLTVTTVTALTANAGTVAINGSNVVYTPAASFFGTFLFTYNAIDNGVSPLSALNPATVTVTVNPFNDPPVLQNKSFSGTEDQPVTMAITAVLANDSPGPGETDTQTLNVTSVAAVTANAGSVAIVGSNVVYTPAANFNGAFVYTYTATDTGVPAKSSTATVTVNMTAVNDAPVPTADTVRAFKNNAARIPFATLLSNDSVGPANEIGQTLTITAVQAPVNGTVSIDTANSVVIFTPAADFTGTASFTYTVQDNGGGATNSATGSVTVNVEEFLPSTIHGTAWVDETMDGAITARERMLAGVRVHLTGTSLGQTVSQEMITLNDGTYVFDDLGPGNYTVTFTAPLFAQTSAFFDVGPYDFDITEPGGADLTQNYSVYGFDPLMVIKVGRLMDQLVSKFQFVDQNIALRGAYFAIGSDNSLSWGVRLDGFENALYTEAVFQGSDLLVTVVDANHVLKTYKVSSQFYAFVTDGHGNKLVRLLGGPADFANVVTTTLANPAYFASNYLASVEEVFNDYDF